MKAILSYLKYFLYALMGASALIGLLFYMEVVSEGLLLGWSYVLFILAGATALLFPIFQFISEPKKAKGTLIGILALTLMAVVSYFMASGEPLNILGYNGPDNVAGTLKLTDMGLFVTYILMFGAFAAIVFTEILNSLK